MKRKILIFGAAGMAGHVMADTLSAFDDYEVVRSARKSAEGIIGADITNSNQVVEVLKSVRPDIVVNCVGMLVAASAQRPDLAILVNSYFPNFLAFMGKELGYKLIHISTDCVFSGKKGGYSDCDFCDGDTAYARTKALGEVINDHDLTIRTSIIGPEIKSDGTGLFDWFMKQSGNIKGYSQAYWSGVTTIELAKAVNAAIRQELIGLYQLTMPEKISKFELLKLFKEVWSKNDVEIAPYDGYFCDKSMICSRNDFDYELPQNYRQMLNEMKQWMIDHKDYYAPGCNC